MATATSAFSQTLSVSSVQQSVGSDVLPVGVICRLTLDNESCIRKNADRGGWDGDKLRPIYSLPRETAEEVFGIEINQAFSKIRISMGSSQDSNEGKVDRIRFFDVTEENKGKLREVLEFTETLYKVNQISCSESNVFYQYVAEQSNLYDVLLFGFKSVLTEKEKGSIKSAEKFIAEDKTYLELKSKMNNALKKTWDTNEQMRGVAKEHGMWPWHFCIYMTNPYKNG